jgi:hypothetical protein
MVGNTASTQQLLQWSENCKMEPLDAACPACAAYLKATALLKAMWNRPPVDWTEDRREDSPYQVTSERPPTQD